jgi:hypothetical protein
MGILLIPIIWIALIYIFSDNDKGDGGSGFNNWYNNRR